MDLIRIIAKHHYGLGQVELIVKSKLPDRGSTVHKLHHLEEAGFIRSLVPYGHKNRGIYYLIDDEYSLFYLYWIESNLKTIAKKAINQGFWLSQSNQSAWKVWVGLAFESVYYKHIGQIRHVLNIDPGSIVGTWRYCSKSKR
ncbi:MAG: uncharacterized protein QG627_1311 [Chlamydiota bacterium]|jgi:hypothetical protein|nr:uncharacterized protein [Chlamydiota bacterium]